MHHRFMERFWSPSLRSPLRLATAFSFLVWTAFPAYAGEEVAQLSSSFFDGNGGRRGASQLSLPPAPKVPDRRGGDLIVRLFDGARKSFPSATPVFLRVFDGNQKERMSRYLRGPEIMVQGLPIYDNFGDNYRVIVWANGHKQAGAAPVPLKRGRLTAVDLMLPADKSDFDFSGASWENVSAKNPALLNVLKGEPKGADSRSRYERLLAEKPESAACLLNIAAALQQIKLGHGTPLEQLEYLIWDDTMKRDRFWAHAHAELLDDVRNAKNLFKRVKGEGLFHPGAVESFKQVQFEGGNVQLTFHPAQRSLVRGHECILVEIDIDLHKDTLAHILLEVAPNLMRHGQTDPKAVYQIRWTAGRRAGAPEFDPLYTLVAR